MLYTEHLQFLEVHIFRTESGHGQCLTIWIQWPVTAVSNRNSLHSDLQPQPSKPKGNYFFSVYSLHETRISFLGLANGKRQTCRKQRKPQKGQKGHVNMVGTTQNGLDKSGKHQNQSRNGCHCSQNGWLLGFRSGSIPRSPSKPDIGVFQDHGFPVWRFRVSRCAA